MKKTLWAALVCLCMLLLLALAGCGSDGKDPTLLPKTAGEVASSDAELFFVDFHKDKKGSSVKDITLSDDGNRLPSGVTQSDNRILIGKAGSYRFTGTSSNSMILVNAPDQLVHLIFDNLTLTCQNGAPVYVQDAKAVVITAKDGTVNTLSDAASYTYVDAQRMEPDAAICSRTDLTFNGSGTLIVNAKGADAIKGKDALRLLDLRIEVNSEKEGICGKDALILYNVRGDVKSKQDGLKSNQDLDPTRGFVLLNRCELNIDAGQDGIQAQTAMVMAENTLDITSGGGHKTVLAVDAKSCKGIKAETRLVIDSGNYVLNTADDGLHAVELTVNGGDITLKAGTDGLQGDSSLTVNGGNIFVTDAEDGVTAGNFTQNGGALKIVCADDAITARSDAALSFVPHVNMLGGNLQIHAQGDGIKSDGNITISGGVALVFSDTGCNNPPINAVGDISITGGDVVVSGNVTLTDKLPAAIPQALFRCSTSLLKGGIAAVNGAGGAQVLAFDVPESALTVLVLSSKLAVGQQYQLTTATTHIGDESTNGIYGNITLVKGVIAGTAAAG